MTTHTPHSLNAWAAQQGLPTGEASPLVRAGEPCPCRTQTPWGWLTALAIAVAAWWF